MLGFGNRETLWLDVTNFGLAIVCLLCVAAAIVGVARDLAARRRRRTAQVVKLDRRAFMVPELGVTMADGGESRGDSLSADRPS